MSLRDEVVTTPQPSSTLPLDQIAMSLRDEVVTTFELDCAPWLAIAMSLRDEVVTTWTPNEKP